MKKPDWKLGKALNIVTAVYLVCSVFGCALYMVLPPVLSSVGARIHAYLLFTAAMNEGTSIWPVVLAVIGHVFVLAQVIFGVIALKTGRLRLFTLLTVLELLLTTGFLAYQNNLGNEFTAGILLNIAYCLWLFRTSLSGKTAAIK